MHENKDKLILICAVPRRELNKVKEISRKIDPRSFIIITNSREVLGLGFRKEYGI